MGSDVRMLRIGKGARCIVHRTDDIAREGQCGIVGGSTLGKRGTIVVPLCSIDGLCAQQVGIGSLPTTRYGGSVEVDTEMMTSCTLKQVNHKGHILIGIAREEVNLDTYYTKPSDICEFTFTVFRFIESELRSWSTINPTNAATIPYQGLDTLRNSITHGILHGLSVLHLVPFCINQDVWKMKGCCHIGVLLDDVIVV